MVIGPVALKLELCYLVGNKVRVVKISKIVKIMGFINMKKVSDKTIIKTSVVLMVVVLVSVGLVVTNAMLTQLSDKYVNSLLRKVPFTDGGVSHPWYIAPMKGFTVVLYNGSQYVVNSDRWYGCEHNPEQGHSIGIGYTNKTAYDERVQLDENVTTRNYTETYKTIAWVNATQVKTVIFEAW